MGFFLISIYKIFRIDSNFNTNLNHTMNDKITTELWILILKDTEVTNPEIKKILQIIYSFPNHQTNAGTIGKILGQTGKCPQGIINTAIGRYAKRMASKNFIDISIRQNQKFKYWDLFFDGWEEGRCFIWKIREELAQAMLICGLVELDNIDYVDEINDTNSSSIFEGAKKIITVNSFERNPKARKQCIEKYGYNCAVCNFNFENKYGKIGKGFIHIHHIKPISEINQTYQIDPIKDLIPLCPNCHAMIHKRTSIYSINELKQVYNDNKI